MKNIFRAAGFYAILLFCTLRWISCSKTNPAGSEIPTKELTLISEIVLTFQEPSGIAFSETMQKMWVVSGGNQRVYALDTNGFVEDRLSFSGTDLEGIAFDESDSTLWVIDEATKEIFHLGLNGNILFQKPLVYTAEPNNGPEGITIGNNRVFYVVNEKNPSLLLTLDSAYEITQTHPLTFASDYSDISYDGSTGTYFILSDESKAFFRVNENMEAMEQYSLPTDKNEGIAYDAQREIFYIVNDAANTLSRYKVK